MSRNVVQEYDTWAANGNGTFAHDSKVASKTPYIRSMRAQMQKVCYPNLCSSLEFLFLELSMFLSFFLFFFPCFIQAISSS